MYKKFYNLKQNPFRLTPDPHFVCMTGQHREALSGLIYSVCTRPGLTLLIGEAGTGKTTLIYTMLALLEKKKFTTAVLNNPTLTRAEFFDMLLAKLGVECSSTLKSQQLIALQESLLRNRADGRPCVLVVDEAQRLSMELLEEVRLLLNLETAREKLLQIIMAGQQELMDVFRNPDLRQLKQRISYSCKLTPLSLSDLREYIHHRLSRAGCPNQTLFSEEAILTIYEYTTGIPRLVNTLCDNALQSGFALQSSHITLSIIEEAAADLDMLPSPSLGMLADDAEGRFPAGMVPVSQEASGSREASVADLRGEHEEYPSPRIPLESYPARQKSFGFLAGLLDRWR